MTVIARPHSLRAKFARLSRDCRGTALIEFAYLLPVFTVIGFSGVELANFAVANLQVNQVAISLADNVSRAKQASASGAPRLREYDIQDSFIAATRQGGALDLQANGRMVISSLEVNATGGQWVHWQRCSGNKAYSPQYGVQGDGQTGNGFPGMGPANRRLVADADSAIMFVEVAYDYQPLLTTLFTKPVEIRKIAAMYVRDDRDLTQVYNPSPAVTVAAC